MVLILGFPFELFLYRCVNDGHTIMKSSPRCFSYHSVLLFLLALLSHCVHHGAIVQLIFACIFGTLVLFCLIGYWLITEPCNDVYTLSSGSQVTGSQH